MAYRLLGQVGDAEDVVQEAWLRWSRTDQGQVSDPQAFLMRVVTRLAIDQLRRQAVRRESYVGPWLPEPLAADLGPDAAAEIADSVSIALLVVLETLSPLERAVFVLGEVFGHSHAEIAAMLDRTPAAVRQLAHRAKQHVRDRRPRFEADQGRRARVTAAFLRACQEGDLGALLAVLAPDVVFVGDSGGVGRAPRHPIYGADKVARFLLAIRDTPVPDMGVEIAEVNAGPAIIVRSAGVPMTVFVLDVRDGLVITIHAIANPAKLRHLPTPQAPGAKDRDQ